MYVRMHFARLQYMYESKLTVPFQRISPLTINTLTLGSRWAIRPNATENFQPTSEQVSLQPATELIYTAYAIYAYIRTYVGLCMYMYGGQLIGVIGLQCESTGSILVLFLCIVSSYMRIKLYICKPTLVSELSRPV